MTPDKIIDVDQDDDSIVTPQAVDEKLDTNTKSPAEKSVSFLAERLNRNFLPAGKDHPLSQRALEEIDLSSPPTSDFNPRQSEPAQLLCEYNPGLPWWKRRVLEELRSSANVKLTKELSDGIYSGMDPYWREWPQNHIAADVREAKRQLKNQLGIDALFHEVEHEHPEIDGTNTLLLPKTAREIFDLARDEVGYIPTVEFVLDHTKNKLVTRDNGIGFTAGEVVDVWVEPAESGSGTDLSSAGTKGLGSLTAFNMTPTDGGLFVRTRTRRKKTLMTEQPVPQTDRDGFKFLSFLGSVIPTRGEVEEGFYGTEFEIPLKSDLAYTKFFDKLADFAEISPVTISWYESGNGTSRDEEIEATGFFERYDEDVIEYERPGEFRMAMGPSGTVSTRRHTNDTFLMDNPIDRNTTIGQKVDTMFNVHLQLLNEQGLIIAGPHRGQRQAELDELYGEREWIRDDNKPMPDVPLPEPATNRESLQSGEAHDRFIEYVTHVGTQLELERIEDYLNNVLESDTPEEVVEVIRDGGAKYDLVQKLLSDHAPYQAYKRPRKLMNFLHSRDQFNFDLKKAKEAHEVTNDEVDFRPKNLNVGGNKKWTIQTHPKYEIIETFCALGEDVSWADDSMSGDPDNKDNRENDPLGYVIGTMQKWPIYIGKSINRDRLRVLWNEENHPDAAAVKPGRYSQWQEGKFEPFYGGLVKNVPFNWDADNADGWTIPAQIHDRHTTTKSTTDDGDDEIKNTSWKIRHTENSAVDTRTDFETVQETVNNRDFGEVLAWDGNDTEGQKPWLVLFPDPWDEQISDHYELSQVTNIAKCTKSAAEELHQSRNVFYVWEFNAMLADTEIEYSSPFNGQTYTGSFDDVFGDATMVFTKDADRKGDTLQHGIFTREKTLEELPDPDEESEMFNTIRRKTFEKILPDTLANAAKPAYKRDSDAKSWVIIDADQFSSVDNYRIGAYIRLQAGDDELDTYQNYVAKDVMLKTYSIRGDGLLRGGWPADVDIHQDGVSAKDVKRAQYPQWDLDSNAWSRLNSTYRGPKPPEKGLLKFARDLGIDPFEEYFVDNPERLRQALNELTQR